MFDLLSLALTVGAGVTGFIWARRFVRGRLRFVDAVYSPFAPILAGGLAAMLFWPAAALPLITATAPAVFGIGVGMGTSTGVRDLRRMSLPNGR